MGGWREKKQGEKEGGRERGEIGRRQRVEARERYISRRIGRRKGEAEKEIKRKKKHRYIAWLIARLRCGSQGEDGLNRD